MSDISLRPLVRAIRGLSATILLASEHAETPEEAVAMAHLIEGLADGRRPSLSDEQKARRREAIVAVFSEAVPDDEDI